jgi:hypothetical protein
MALPKTGAEAQILNGEYPYTTEIDSGDDKLNHRVTVQDGVGVDTITESQRVTETDPARFGQVPEDISPADNLAAATYYYPSSDGLSMLGFKSMSLSGVLVHVGTTASVLTCEMRNHESGTWIPVAIGVDTVTAAAAASLSSATTPGTSFNWQFDDFNGMFFRFKLVVTETTNSNELMLQRTPI